MAHSPLTRRTALSVALLAAAVLLQGTLLRLLAVATPFVLAWLTWHVKDDRCP